MDGVIPRMPSANKPVDTDDLLKRCLGRMDIVERILSRFQNVLDDDLDQLERALRSSNSDEIAQIAHRIKGASLAVSAYGLSDCASRIESSAMAGQADLANAQFELMKESRTLFRAVFPISSKEQSTREQSGPSFQENTRCES